MKKIISVAVLTCALVFAGHMETGQAKDLGIYLGGHLGMSVQGISGRSIHEEVTQYGGIGSWSGSSGSKSVFGGGVALGYDFKPRFNAPVRLELNYTGRGTSEVTSSKEFKENTDDYVLNWKDRVRLQTLMFNVWVDIPTGTAFTPYLGGGLGWGFINYKNTFNGTELTNNGAGSFIDGGSQSKTNFAWSLGGGLSYDMTDHFTVDLGYRYINAGKVRFRSAGIDPYQSRAKVTSHDVMLGVRYTF